jgi:hypothetical protein
LFGGQGVRRGVFRQCGVYLAVGDIGSESPLHESYSAGKFLDGRLSGGAACPWRFGRREEFEGALERDGVRALTGRQGAKLFAMLDIGPPAAIVGNDGFA